MLPYLKRLHLKRQIKQMRIKEGELTEIYEISLGDWGHTHKGKGR